MKYRFNGRYYEGFRIHKKEGLPTFLRGGCKHFSYGKWTYYFYTDSPLAHR